MKDRFNLNNRIALVTGGAGLLSSQHSNAVLKGNGTLILVDVDKKKLNFFSKKLNKNLKQRVYSFVCDITNEKKDINHKKK